MKCMKILGYFVLGVSVMSGMMAFIKPSCFLCDIERVCLLIISISILLQRNWLAFSASVITIGISTYHLLLQYHVILQPSVCHVNIMKMGKRISCNDMSLMIFNLPLPVYVCVISVICCVLLLVARKQC